MKIIHMLRLWLQQESSEVCTDTNFLSVSICVKVQSFIFLPMKSRIQPTVPSPPQARTLKFGTSLKKFSLQKADSKIIIVVLFFNGFISCIWITKWKASCFIVVPRPWKKKKSKMFGWVLTSFSCSSFSHSKQNIMVTSTTEVSSAAILSNSFKNTYIFI